jgi:hypothetical protein
LTARNVLRRASARNAPPPYIFTLTNRVFP